GGGIGRSEGVEGDGGGFGTNGYSAALNRAEGGQRHGNEPVVPIAGGSGGASGNPRGLGACSGEGGGGGGAIRIAGLQVRNIRIEAKGAEGGSGNRVPGAPPGGAGSGGHIALHSWNDVDSVHVSVVGGDANRSIYFGAGRLRYDTPNRISSAASGGSIMPPERRSGDTVFSSYTGITLEPRRGVISPYTTAATINGFGGAAGGIFFFRKTLRGRWEGGGTDSVQLGASTEQGRNSRIEYRGLFTPITSRALLEQDSLLFVVAVQRSFFPTPLGQESIPEWTMSQSGTSILRILPLPLITLNPPIGSELVFPAIERCGNEERSSSAVLHIVNRRGGVLFIDSIKVTSPLFRIDTASLQRVVLQQNDTLRLPLRCTVPQDFPATSRAAEAQIALYHNDTIPDIGGEYRPSPLFMRLRAPVRTVQFDIRTSVLDTLIHFGTVPVGSVADTLISIRNLSGDPVRFNVRAERPHALTPFILADRVVAASDTLQLRVRFQPSIQGQATTQTIIVQVSALGRCTDQTIMRFTLSGIGTQPMVDVPLTGPVRIDTALSVCFPQTVHTEGTLTIASAGNDILRVNVRMSSTTSSFTPIPAEFSLQPNREQIVRLRFTALSTTSAVAMYRDTVVVITNDIRPTARVIRFPVQVTVRNIAVLPRAFPRDTLRFGDVAFFRPTRRSILVTNAGNVLITLALRSLRAPFRIVQPVTTGTLHQPLLNLQPGAADSIVIEMLATDAQMPDVSVRDVLHIAYSGISQLCTARSDSILVIGTPRGLASMPARVWLDTLRSVDMLRDTSIRIWGQVLGTAVDKRDNFYAALRIRRGMFFPRTISSPFGAARIDSQRVDSLDRITVVSIPNVLLTSSTTLIATIHGTPIVTDTMRSAVEWIHARTRWMRGDSVYAVLPSDYGHGLLVMNVILQGQQNAPRLPNNAVRRSPKTHIAVYPSPAQATVTLEAELQEKGTYVVQIANTLGSIVYSHEWKPHLESVMISSHTASLSIPVENLPAGVYMLMLILPSGERVSTILTIGR
ncbi:MAG: hypothetical protein RML40_06080, partial [Bacteroidota bacterium]|nr:T9SS type A sorting domain-containing protein [Candidatus Kapabacteria bacterium]MDW8220082.1 hypothetical protein [Bacteroidota bacterium]